MYVNLLPTTFIWKQLIYRRLRQWATAFAMLGFVMLAVNAQLLSKWMKCNSQLQATHQDSEPIRKLETDRLQSIEEALSIQTKAESLKDLVGPDRILSLLGIVSQSSVNARGPVQIQEMHVSIQNKQLSTTASTSRTGGDGKETPKPSDVETEMLVTLRGIAADSSTITSFMQGLQESKVFPRVELRSTREKLVSERSIHEFQLECIHHE